MDPKVEMLDVAKISRSPHTARVIKKNDRSVKELAMSIEAQGLINPISVRPHPKKRNWFEVLAGERRLEAFRSLNLDKIPAVVRKLNDQEAMAITITENLQREDLSPIQQATEISKLLKKGQEIKEIAATLGRSISWVMRRAKLLDLDDGVKAELERNYPNFGPAHMELIARYPAETQKAFLEDHYYADEYDLKQLEKALAEFTGTLKQAPWDLNDESLDPKAGACSACPKRSSCQPELFAETDAAIDKVKNDDRCLDPACYDNKMKLFIPRKIQELKKEHPDILQIAASHNSQLTGVLMPRDYMAAKKTDKKAKPAIVVHGPGTGQLKWINLTGSSPASRQAATKGEGMSMAGKKQRIYNRRNALIVTGISKELDKLTDKQLGFEKKLRMAAIVAAFGTHDKKHMPSKTDFNNLANFNRREKAMQAALWKMIKPVLKSRLFFYNGDGATRLIPEAKRICKLFDINFKSFEKKALAEIPDPKSWSKAQSKKKKAKSAPKGVQGQKAAPKSKKKKSSKRPANAAFMKPLTPSDQLAEIVGSNPIPRTEITKKVWAYIKKHKLQDPNNKRMLIADDKLKALFKGKVRVSIFDMTKYIAKHMK